jgi:hypothetical protein
MSIRKLTPDATGTSFCVLSGWVRERTAGSQVSLGTRDAAAAETSSRLGNRDKTNAIYSRNKREASWKHATTFPSLSTSSIVLTKAINISETSSEKLILPDLCYLEVPGESAEERHLVPLDIVREVQTWQKELGKLFLTNMVREINRHAGARRRTMASKQESKHISDLHQKH